MRIELNNRSRRRSGSIIIPYFILLLITASAIAGLGVFVAHSTNMAHRRNDLIAAADFAQGGAVIACSDLNQALTNRTGTIKSKVEGKGYQWNSALSTSAQMVYHRTITAPFADQVVDAEIWLPNSSSPSSAKIVARALTGKVTQQATVNVKMSWAYPAAIINVSPGTTSATIDKATGKSGNVVVDGSKSGPIIVDGGPARAILSNGRANIDTAYATVPASAISQTNYNTANEVPDFTAQGTVNTLFDFNRFIAVADLTTNTLNPTLNNHFTNLTTFIAAANAAAVSPAGALEGVIVVDIAKTDPDLSNLTATKLPNGINVKGTLFFNFALTFGPLDYVINSAAMNINPANLAGLVATDPKTYPTGYPPVYYDVTKNPTNIDITAKGFANFVSEDDLPALMYSIGTLDMHGNANVSGVMYTPSYVEIENLKDGQIQYFKGALIMGMGIYYQNVHSATSIISFDPQTLDGLATMDAIGKKFAVTYWQ